MSAEKLISKSLENPIGLAVGAAVIIGLVYYLGRKTLSDVASGVGGIASGNNAATQGTAYEGKGILGTVGAVVNSASGGSLAAIGEWLGGSIYDIVHIRDANTPPKENNLIAYSDIDGRPSSVR